MNPSKNHNNWITVGEIIKSITIPVACYADHVLKNWHAKLCQHCLVHGLCSNPDCQRKRKPSDLCPSCQGWYQELASSHRNKNESQIKWSQNCNTSKWPSDKWEVAKFFMSTLGANKSSVQDAKSTDLSSLLNFLEWVEDVAFGADRRVAIKLIIELRSEVRNSWAHAPNQEMTEDQLQNAFAIADQFLLDLNAVFNYQEVMTCIEEIKSLKIKGLTNVVEAELNNLLLLRNELGGDVSKMKEEIKNLKQDQNSNRQIIEKNEKELGKLEDFTVECCKRMEELQKWKLDLDKLFDSFQLKIDSFRDETRKNFTEIKELLTANKIHENQSLELRSVIPERLLTFRGRKNEVNQIISSLNKENCGIVSIVGGPGFGKSTIAVEVCHQVSGNKGIPVIFSYLSPILTVDDVTRRLCHDVGVNPGKDPESSLMLWLKNMKQETILVMDNIEQLLEGERRSQFTDLVRMLRKNSNQQLKILITSRNQLKIDGLKMENVKIMEMDDVSSVELLKTFCQEEQVDDKYLRKLASLCGNVPLALSIVASRIQDTDPEDLLKWLEDKPMEALQTLESDLHVQKAIEMSFSKLSEEDQKAFVRLGVFNGNFDFSAAEEVLQKCEFEVQNFFTKLANRSLIERNGKRYQIHLLVKQFLASRDQFQDEWSIAQQLMVQYFLKVCQSLTEKFYSKDECNGARKSLAKDAHHVKEMIRLCKDEVSNVKPGIVESLEHSDIYQSSSRFFYYFIQSVLLPSTVENFLKSCAERAKKRSHLAIEINFQCLLVDEEGHRSNWESDEYMERAEKLKETFDKNKGVLEYHNAVVSHFYYGYGRYLSNKKATPSCNKFSLLEKAADFLELSWSLRQYNAQSQNPLEKADEAITLIQLGRINRLLANERKDKAKEYEHYMNLAENCFQRALSLAHKLLGDHDLTATCYKYLGDLFMPWQKNEEALEYYEDAKSMFKRLQFESNCAVVNLLKNYGLCFFYLDRYNESAQQLHEAREIADKLAKTDANCKARATVYFSLATVFRKWKGDCPEVIEFANEALTMKKFLKKGDVHKLKNMRFKSGTKDRQKRQAEINNQLHI